MRNLVTNQRLWWFLLLLPVALLAPALTIDENRYLSIAWEMRTSGDMLMPHLNGMPYSDKGPLLFWLVSIAWLCAGLHVWIVRLGLLVASLISLVLFERLVRRLDPADAESGGDLAARSTTVLSGMFYFALFAIAIMFDALLTTCVLIALHGVLDLDGRRWWRGVLVLTLGLSLGLLTKGPAVLLDACMVGLFAPWWSQTARVNMQRWYTCMLFGILGGIAIALVWALLAYGGFDTFWKAVILRQTIGRISESFAHARPVWWYLVVLPLIVLPWTLSLRAPWYVWRNSFGADKTARFTTAWIVPPFLIFCLFISGKQPHYLLPLLPGFALYFAHVLRDDAACVRGRLFGLLLVVVGLALTATPYLANHAATLPWLGKLVRDGSFSAAEQKVIGGVWPLWGLLIAAIGAFLLGHPRAHARLGAVALSNVAVVTLGMLTLTQAVGPTADVTAAAMRIHAAQESSRPIAHLGWHHGLFGFPGRLTKPLEAVNLGDLYQWCTAHPNGEVITFYTKYGVPAKPEAEIPYRLGRILIWRASDLCEAPHIVPSAKTDEEDTGED